jgi:hypothetical protein
VNTESLAGLIARRDELKIKVDMHHRADPSQDAPGDTLRDELSTVIGAITTLLHEPYRVEAARLAQRRRKIAEELTQAHYQRNQLRCAHGHAQGHRSAALAAGDDPAEHTSSSRRLSVELHDIETRIGELEHRVQGLDGQLTELVVAEGAQMISGVSAS